MAPFVRDSEPAAADPLEAFAQWHDAVLSWLCLEHAHLADLRST